jgi:hypothetical protein
MAGVRRRDVIAAISSALGTAAISGGGGDARAESPPPQATDDRWKYLPLSPSAVADEAYRQMPDGGCMYGVVKAVLSSWSKEHARPLDEFPFHMFRYGEGGIGGFGSICGALNGGAALIGLFENTKSSRTQLIGELFSWYERTALPRYRPADQPTARMPRSVAESVLCHVSVSHWCQISGATPLSKEMGQRCRCLTADVAAKAVKLLNEGVAGLPVQPEVTPASATEPPKSIGKMRCATCHETAEPDPLNASVRIPNVQP